MTTFNPSENLAGLESAGVPIFIPHGDSDIPVPYLENGELVR